MFTDPFLKTLCLIKSDAAIRHGAVHDSVKLLDIMGDGVVKFTFGREIPTHPKEIL